MTRLEEIKERYLNAAKGRRVKVCTRCNGNYEIQHSCPDGGSWYSATEASKIICAPLTASNRDVPWLVSQLEKATELAKYCFQHRFDAVPFDVQDKAREFLEQMK